MSNLKKMREEQENRLKVLQEKQKELSNKNITNNNSIKNDREIADKIYQIGLKTGEKPTMIPLKYLKEADPNWNIFPALPDEKHLELIFSIIENGLFSPIIVWEQEPMEEYIILSGHNRVRAFKDIVKLYLDFDPEYHIKLMGNEITEERKEFLRNFDASIFNQIPAFVYKKHDIDEAKAREIILDTNYIQRGKDPRTEPMVISMRLQLKKNQEDVKGKKMHLVAKELGISPTKVYENDLFANHICPELQKLYFNGNISKKSLIRVKDWDFELQKWLHDEFKDFLTSKTFNKFSTNKKYSKNDIVKIIEAQLDKPELVPVKLDMEAEFVEDFKKMASKWLANKRYRTKESQEEA